MDECPFIEYYVSELKTVFQKIFHLIANFGLYCNSTKLNLPPNIYVLLYA